jgi:hypothetical protein
MIQANWVLEELRTQGGRGSTKLPGIGIVLPPGLSQDGDCTLLSIPQMYGGSGFLAYSPLCFPQRTENTRSVTAIAPHSYRAQTSPEFKVCALLTTSAGQPEFLWIFPRIGLNVTFEKSRLG